MHSTHSLVKCCRCSGSIMVSNMSPVSRCISKQTCSATVFTWLHIVLKFIKLARLHVLSGTPRWPAVPYLHTSVGAAAP